MDRAQRQVRLNFKIFNDVDNMYRAKALNKNKRQISKNMEIGCEKIRKSGQQGENERQCRKKSEQEHDKTLVSTYDIFQHK